MDIRVERVEALDTIRQVIRLHDAVWKGSIGILDLLRNSTACYLLRGPRGRVLGYAFVEEDRKRGFFELQDIVVDKRCRRGGHGRRLMEAVVADCKAVKLLARASDAGLVAFYTSLGFVEENRFENYYDVGEDAVRMTLKA
jgi:ribosomal protein S18 acetylase RimI-like enzyme